MLSDFLIIPVVKENTIVKPVIVIATGAPTTVAWEIMQTPLVVSDKTIKSLCM